MESLTKRQKMEFAMCATMMSDIIMADRRGGKVAFEYYVGCMNLLVILKLWEDNGFIKAFCHYFQAGDSLADDKNVQN